MRLGFAVRKKGSLYETLSDRSPLERIGRRAADRPMRWGSSSHAFQQKTAFTFVARSRWRCLSCGGRWLETEGRRRRHYEDLFCGACVFLDLMKRTRSSNDGFAFPLSCVGWKGHSGRTDGKGSSSLHLVSPIQTTSRSSEAEGGEGTEARSEIALLGNGRGNVVASCA